MVAETQLVGQVNESRCSTSNIPRTLFPFVRGLSTVGLRTRWEATELLEGNGACLGLETRGLAQPSEHRWDYRVHLGSAAPLFLLQGKPWSTLTEAWSFTSSEQNGAFL